ncbi:MAG: glycosyltransferase family protein [Candidatus Diapherotrites archaeon]|nr:glycosyltransferase family protein [Candidatus Diapherotrites archaeon]
MTRILYSVCGIGMGHATRSTYLIEELSKQNEVLILSHGKAFEYFSKKFPHVHKIEGFELGFSGTEFDKSKTVSLNLPKVPRLLTYNSKVLLKLIKSFKPQLIVTDFDPNALFAGNFFRIPVITITNMHLMNFIKPKLSWKDKFEFFWSEKIILKSFSSSNDLIVSSFAKPKNVKKKKYHFFYPLVRREILELSKKIKVSHKKTSVIYLDQHILKNLEPLLVHFPERTFIIYSAVGNLKLTNVVYKKFDAQNFLADLIACDSVICHGGISMLSEAVVLHKPVYVCSDKNFFERYYNGTVLQDQGLAVLEEQPFLAGLKVFFNSLQEINQNYTKTKIVPENEKILKKIQQIIKQKAKSENYKLPLLLEKLNI